MVHFKEVCRCEKAGLFEARIFKDGSFENRDKWSGSFNVHIQGQEACVSLLDKGWSREVNDKTVKFLKDKGVKLAKWERRGKTLERRI